MKSSINKIDIFSFCATAQQAGALPKLQGTTALGDFQRFLQGMLPQESSAAVVWMMTPGKGLKGELLVHLQVQTVVTLQCQRCGGSFVFPIDSHQTVEIVHTLKETVDDLDVDALLEEYEQVLGSKAFDVLSLVEDELVLSIPYIPRHEVCPPSDWIPDSSDAMEEKKPSPFAVLAALKNKSSS